MSPYELTVEDAGNGTVLVALAGELDLTNAPELEARLDAAAGDAPRLVIDLNAVEFLDSAVLHVLFRIARRRGVEGLALVASPEAPTRRALTLVGLDRVATLEASLGTLDPPDGA